MSDQKNAKSTHTPADDNISLCNDCNCMTHTINGRCGKCQGLKDTPADEHPRTWGQMKLSENELDRLAVYINGLSPHNLWKARELLAAHIKATEVNARLDELNNWFDQPKHYKGEEYRDVPFAQVKCKTPNKTQYYMLDSNFTWALSSRIKTLKAESEQV